MKVSELMTLLKEADKDEEVYIYSSGVNGCVTRDIRCVHVTTECCILLEGKMV